MKKIKNIHLCALGGTIAMSAAAGASGVTPSLTSEDLVAAVPELQHYASLTTYTLDNVASSNLGLDHAVRIIDYAIDAEAAGADGLVITQGTDTLEEMSFILSLVWDGAMPIVFTAAMRHPATAGADGPANLLAAVQTACHAEKGTYVVMNNEVHDPALVQKSHTSAVNAFKSEFGPIGVITEGQVTMTSPLSPGVRMSKARLKSPHRVALIAPTLGDDPWQLEAAVEGPFDALVVASFGGGHVSEKWADALRVAAVKLPVILASRVSRGRIFTSTYGYKGAEIDLINAGMIPAGGLNAHKARLYLALQETLDTAAVTKAFADQ